MDDLREVPVVVLASQAQKLARMGRITGEAALSLIVWPNPPDMIHYLKALRASEEYLKQLAA